MSQYKTTEANEPASRAAQRAVEKHLKKLPVRLKRAAKARGQNSEKVHKLRVNCRKAAAALKLFDKFLPSKKSRRLERQLAKILHATGGARDLGVMAKHHRGALAAMARKQAGKARHPLEKAARPGHRRHLERMIEDVVKQAGGRTSLPFRRWVRPKIREFGREFLAAKPAKGAPLKKLHKFRIRGKELRYAIEIAEEAFIPVRRQKVLARMESIQEELGRINDLASENAYLAEWRQAGKNKALSHFLLQRIGANRTEIARRKAAFEKRCSPQFMKRFRRELKDMLKA